MASAPFDFEVITPEGSAFRGKVTSLRLQGRDGTFGVLARHAPLLAVLDAGVLRVRREDGKELAFAVGEGFVEVRRAGPRAPVAVRALVDFCNPRSKIDVARAEKAKARAKERVRKRDAKIDQARAEAALKRAIARLATAGIPGLE
jgi:F-type H+-transporting ATPase subunit epsilon